MKKINSRLPITQIVFDQTLYPRNQYFWQVAYDYSESMKTGVKFPKITVAKLGDVFILVDGKHRLEANKLLKKKVVEVEVLVGLNKQQIFEEAIKRNIGHGKTLSVQEKLNIAVRLRDMHYDTQKISKLIQIPADKLKDLIGRRLYNSITGEEIILKKSFEDINEMSDRSEVAQRDIEFAQKEFQGSDQTGIIRELIILLENKVLNLENPQVVALLSKLKKLLKDVQGI